MKRNANLSSFACAALVVALLAVVAWALPATAADDGGKDIFLAQKCNMCHSVDSQGIEKMNDKMKGPDLSEVGSRHEADWIKQYLLREETMNGKKHSKPLKLSDGEMDTLVGWLSGLTG